ncbi:hypothetical protein N9V04_01195, partial [Bacteroidota bacterium]|nr:hypothetical protein [Bacteroidota bacterium]
MNIKSIIRHALALLILCISTLISFGQSNDQWVFNYQAIAHDAAGDTIGNEELTATIAITDVNQNILYEEEHQVTTNQFGLFYFKIGEGIPTASYPNLVDLDWSIESFWMHIEIVFDYNGAFNDLGYHPLVSVPYAMTARYAQSTDSVNGFFVEKDVPSSADFTDDQQLSISNDTLILEDGGFIDLSVYKDTFNQIDSTGIANLGFFAGPHTINTDQQQLDSVVYDPISSDLTIYLENSISKTVNLSSLNNKEVIGVTFLNSDLNISFSDGSSIIENISSVNTDNQQLSFSNDTLYLESGGSFYLGYQNGLDGATGATGPTGQNGLDGADGQDGQVGATGAT